MLYIVMVISHLATIDMDRKLGGELSPHLTHVAWAEAYLPTKWHLDPSSHLAIIDRNGPKIGGSVLFWEGSWVPI